MPALGLGRQTQVIVHNRPEFLACQDGDFKVPVSPSLRLHLINGALSDGIFKRHGFAPHDEQEPALSKSSKVLQYAHLSGRRGGAGGEMPGCPKLRAASRLTELRAIIVDRALTLWNVDHDGRETSSDIDLAGHRSS